MGALDMTFGPAYCEAVDGGRLARQYDKIMSLMADRNWRTLHEISAALGYSEASISAQLRHAKKPQFGSWRMEKQRRKNELGLDSGTWEYRILPPAVPVGAGHQGGLFA
jgi:hypothetical protein